MSAEEDEETEEAALSGNEADDEDGERAQEELECVRAEKVAARAEVTKAAQRALAMTATANATAAANAAANAVQAALAGQYS
jgi:hypothetical protein